MNDILSSLLTDTKFFLIVIAAIVLYAWYASIIKRKNKVMEALGGIDAQLTKRHDLIPNILEIARAFMAHETELLSEITELRTQGKGAVGGSRSSEEVAKQLGIENLLGAKMGQFNAVAESYPQLRSSELMMNAQSEYSNVEDNLAAARRFYNSAVGDLNNSVQIFPGSLLAKVAGVTEYPFYEAPESHRAPVNAADFFKK